MRHDDTGAVARTRSIRADSITFPEKWPLHYLSVHASLPLSMFVELRTAVQGRPIVAHSASRWSHGQQIDCHLKIIINETSPFLYSKKPYLRI